jgi:polyisoprenoid-binding protein YceI
MTNNRADNPIPSGTWNIDPNHTVVGAVARHLMVTKVRGRFKIFQGAIHVEESIEDSWAELEIDAASIDTGVEDRDKHLRSADFLDVEHHPKIAYRSSKVERTGENTLRVEGDMTILGITRPVPLDVTFEGLTSDPWGGTRIGFTATGQLEREQWGMTWNVPLEHGGLLVSKNIQLEIEAQAVRPGEASDVAADAESQPGDQADEAAR